MKVHFYIAVLLLATGLSGCIKEVSTDRQNQENYNYRIEDVTVRKKPAFTNDTTGANKPNIKSTQEFISIAYFDLFSGNISQQELVKLNTLYSAFGDKKLIEDVIIKNFLNRSGISIPSNTQMRADTKTFIADCYKKFYTRKASQIELRDLADLIANDPAVTPEIVYYSFLTSNEYRHY